MSSGGISFPIETDTIGLIQSQTIHECGVDAIQHMLFFADGFREFWAYTAREIFMSHPTEILQENFRGIDRERGLNMATLLMIRRYVLKKLENCGYNAEEINNNLNRGMISLVDFPFSKRSRAQYESLPDKLLNIPALISSSLSSL